MAGSSLVLLATYLNSFSYLWDVLFITKHGAGAPGSSDSQSRSQTFQLQAQGGTDELVVDTAVPTEQCL